MIKEIGELEEFTANIFMEKMWFFTLKAFPIFLGEIMFINKE